MTSVLHWHGEAFPCPPGATPLARSALTPVQAYRLGSAWGVLFHPEADAALVVRLVSEGFIVTSNADGAANDAGTNQAKAVASG